jgi:glutamate racemase
MKPPIGIYDSGAGGLSVLKEAIARMPNEDYVYFGDFLHAPYGMKTARQVRAYAVRAADRLVCEGAKAILIACNTATSAAAKLLEQHYRIPIVGMEPALKDASRLRQSGVILVMATPLTTQLPNFHKLMSEYGEGAVPLPCPGLAEYVQNGILDGKELENFLLNLLADYLKKPLDAVVLGCTHYLFLKPLLKRMLPSDVPLIDNHAEAVTRLETALVKTGARYQGDGKGQIQLLTSGDASTDLPLMERLLYDT